MHTNEDLSYIEMLDGYLSLRRTWNLLEGHRKVMSFGMGLY